MCLSSCARKLNVDMIVYNAKIYTVNSNFEICEAFAIKDGKFIDIGNTKKILKKYIAEKEIDLEGKAVFPGFIDAHSHFYGYGQFSQRIDLTRTQSFAEVIELVKKFADENKDGWILGRGWDQNIWVEKKYPDNNLLNELYPDRPVLLTRVDGHAVLANDEAIRLSKIKLDEYRKFMIFNNNKFTGVLLDNAADILKDAANNLTDEQIKNAFKIAEQACLKVGLTGVCDAGLKIRFIDIIRKMHEDGTLKMRIYAMLEPEEATEQFIKENGIIKTDRLTVCSLKLYADGALGSRGACLLSPYSDDARNYGSILYPSEYYQKYCQLAIDNNYQVCTHAIGDSANRIILNLYSTFLKPGNDKRWRIEHAQVVDKNDIVKFHEYSIIPSVQFVHATSDMKWAAERLGNDRVKNAYAYKELLYQNNWLPYGSDFPVEELNPIFGFYAAVFRKDNHGNPATGFQVENAISRKEALMAMTIWAAKANFEEKNKGSIEKGKFADFIVLDHDIMTTDELNILGTTVLSTFIAGEEVFSFKKEIKK